MKIDKETGEIMPSTHEGTKSFNSFFATLEDGELHNELTDDLRELNASMNNHALNYGAVAKGKITIDLHFKLEKGVFIIVSKKKVTMPEAPRNMSIAYSTPGNNFTTQNPKQQDMFRDVNSKKIKDIA